MDEIGNIESILLCRCLDRFDPSATSTAFIWLPNEDRIGMRQEPPPCKNFLGRQTLSEDGKLEEKKKPKKKAGGGCQWQGSKRVRQRRDR